LTWRASRTIPTDEFALASLHIQRGCLFLFPSLSQHDLCLLRALWFAEFLAGDTRMVIGITNIRGSLSSRNQWFDLGLSVGPLELVPAGPYRIPIFVGELRRSGRRTRVVGASVLAHPAVHQALRSHGHLMLSLGTASPHCVFLMPLGGHPYCVLLMCFGTPSCIVVPLLLVAHLSH